MSIDIVQFNDDWLAAWSALDADRVAAFYAEDARYFDQQLADGIKGRAALLEYLRPMFAAVPSMRYESDAVWPIEGGFCGRWYCTIDLGDGKPQRMRGFDLALLQGDEIVHNEVYTQMLSAEPPAA